MGREERRETHFSWEYGGLSFVSGFEYIIKFAGQTRRFWDCSWRKMVKIVEGNFQRKGQESPLPPVLVLRQSMWSCPVHQKLSVVTLNILSGVCEPEAASCYGILYFKQTSVIWCCTNISELSSLMHPSPQPTSSVSEALAHDLDSLPGEEGAPKLGTVCLYVCHSSDSAYS